METHIKPSGGLHSLQNRGWSGQPRCGKGRWQRGLSMGWNQPRQHSFQLTSLLLLPSLSFCSPHAPHYGKCGQRWLTALSLTSLSSLSFFIQTLHRQGLTWPVLLGAYTWTNQVRQGHSPTPPMWKYPDKPHIGGKKPLLEKGAHSPRQGPPTPSSLETPQSRTWHFCLSQDSFFPSFHVAFFQKICLLLSLWQTNTL